MEFTWSVRGVNDYIYSQYRGVKETSAIILGLVELSILYEILLSIPLSRRLSNRRQDPFSADGL